MQFCIAEGKTWDWREQLKAKGFRWSKANKVWWRTSSVTLEQWVDRVIEDQVDFAGVTFRFVRRFDPAVRLAI